MVCLFLFTYLASLIRKQSGNQLEQRFKNFIHFLLFREKNKNHQLSLLKKKKQYTSLLSIRIT